MSATAEDIVPPETRARAQALSDALLDRFKTENDAAEQLQVPYTTLRRALRPGQDDTKRASTWSTRLDEVEQALARFNQGERVSGRTERPSITDLLDDPERKRAATDGLIVAGGGLVAEGYDADGLMYAVEIVFHIRPDARRTTHGVRMVDGVSRPGTAAVPPGPETTGARREAA